MANVVLFGLDPSAASEIGSALERGGHKIRIKPARTSAEEVYRRGDIVFAAGDDGEYLNLLRDLKQRELYMPVIVVTGRPEAPDWLDALEAGATDYCSGPFDSKQVQWLMETALPKVKTVAA